MPATLVYNGYGFFDTAELYDWVGEGGYYRDPETNRKMRANLRQTSGDESVLEEQKNQMRYGARQSENYPEIWNIWGRGHAATDRKHQKFFGLTVASCEEGDLRQSADGILVYGEDGKREVGHRERHGRPPSRGAGTVRGRSPRTARLARRAAGAKPPSRCAWP